MIRGSNGGGDERLFPFSKHPCPLSPVVNGFRGSFRAIKQPGGKCDHSRPSSAEVKNERSYKSTAPSMPYWRERL